MCDGPYNDAMLYSLVRHSDSVAEVVDRIDVRFTQSTARLILRYAIHGNITALKIPAFTAPRRVDGLWQHTCCELFLRAASTDAYFEFNFSPSTEWAAYRFDAYRSGMTTPNVAAPQIDLRRTDNSMELTASIDLAGLAELSKLSLRVGLSAVIESTDGRKSYWAIQHPAGKPDFHCADCFVGVFPTI